MSGKVVLAVQHIRDHKQANIDILKDYVAFPSISTDPDHFDDIQQAAGWVASQLTGLGVPQVTIYPTSRNPIVYGEFLEAGSQAPTVLIYGHYDVQPPDPLDLWTSPPFKAEIRGEYIYGRGIADMKGQLISCLAALDAIRKTGPMPINLKFLIEGEEEIGSPNMIHFIPEHKQLLTCDFILNLDSGMVSADQPTITYGMRGICVYELTINGPAIDLHSGLFGGAVANPVNVLCKLIGEMRDENGRIMLPGYYDRVRLLDNEERIELNRTSSDDEDILKQTGVPKLWGETGYSAVEQCSVRPTLDVNGIYGGFLGQGIKTIIPASATAKISMRIVPDQDPDEVGDQLRQFVEEHAPDSVSWEIRKFQGSGAVITDRNSPPVQAMAHSLSNVWGKPPLFIRLGASVPVVSLFQQHLNVETVNTGFAIFSESKVHSPDENLHLPTWFRGMEALVHFFLSLD